MLKIVSKIIGVLVLSACGVFFFNLAMLIFYGSGWFSRSPVDLSGNGSRDSQQRLSGDLAGIESQKSQSQKGSGPYHTVKPVKPVKIETHGASHSVLSSGLSPEMISKKYGIGDAGSPVAHEIFEQLKERLASRTALPPENLISLMGKLQMASGKSSEMSDFALSEISSGRSRRHFPNDKDFARFLGTASGVYQNLVPDSSVVYSQMLGVVSSYSDPEIQKALISGYLERNPSRKTEFLKALEQKNILFPSDRGVAGD
ncbi:MAG: hypothetical protein AABZ55_15085 [Bdellovibrionota bacterium]